ncbi:unnamed protein product [Caenorhabditis auriculariae]|uniref:Calcium/calmodulin-dependent protein kinase II association-domain domain-containing protein n=1 Tax=Caenorhabditis auriculariae TaxID=2777116 RepID=A0A8S1HRK4_9PELO|nr:unnamed protein product [Caenorhabditis auriculariae]
MSQWDETMLQILAVILIVGGFLYVTRPLNQRRGRARRRGLSPSPGPSPSRSRSPSFFDLPPPPPPEPCPTDSDQCRNLLNKKEAGGPPSTIKESSESSQTIDDNDSEKGGGQLKHENTVVRADGVVTSSSSTMAASKNTSALSAQKQEIVRVTQQLLDTISSKDFDAYSRLCDTGMTCFEPEALGNLIEGVEFHRFYFDAGSASAVAARKNQVHTTMLNPNVHIVGDDGACIAYVKLTQYFDKNGEGHTRQSQETRVWSKKTGRWICLHVHRSAQPGPSGHAHSDF